MKPFDSAVMYCKYGAGPRYSGQGRAAPVARLFPGLYFYSTLLCGPFRWLAWRAAHDRCDDVAWVYSSAWVGELVEKSGCSIFVEGLENLPASGPRIYIANHMSTLETFLLPGLLRPRGKVTFIVKKSLTELPVFGAIMRSRNPVTVDRKNPREDLVKMLKEGGQRLADGYSLIVFPQSTRSLTFSREHFNSIGVKLAARANIPVIPIALKTDAWGQGKRIKELGRIKPSLPVRIKIGPEIAVSGSGKSEHARICDFMEEHLLKWQKEDGINQ